MKISSKHLSDRRGRAAGAALIVAAVALLAAGVAAAAGNAVEQVVDASSLSAAERAAVVAKAGEAAAAGVASGDVLAVVERALGRNADGPAIESCLAALIAAGRGGVPAGPVADRILQGFAKGVPPARIAASASRLVDSLVKGRRIVGRLLGENQGRGAAERDGAIETAARALEQSVPEDLILETGRKANAGSGDLTLFRRAVETGLSLAAWGLAPEEALYLVHLALDRGFGASDLALMERDALEGVKRGESIQSISHEMASAISRSAGGRYEGIDTLDRRDTGPGARGGGSFGGRMERRR